MEGFRAFMEMYSVLSFFVLFALLGMDTQLRCKERET